MYEIFQKVSVVETEDLLAGRHSICAQNSQNISNLLGNKQAHKFQSYASTKTLPNDPPSHWPVKSVELLT